MKFLFVFYDCETMQNTTNLQNENIHVVNLIIAQHTCSACINVNDGGSNCEYCGVAVSGYEKTQTFLYKNKNSNIVKDFILYVITLQKLTNNNNTTVIAHNNGGFDIHLLINELLKNEQKITPIVSGTKILKLQLGKSIQFIDSLNFLPFSIAKFPKIFDIKELKKGYYPHYFNTIENMSYVGNYPAIEYYGVDSMTVENKKNFLKWYDTVKNDRYNNLEELVNYCLSDVSLLRIGSLNFMKNFLE